MSFTLIVSLGMYKYTRKKLFSERSVLCWHLDFWTMDFLSLFVFLVFPGFTFLVPAHPGSPRQNPRGP